MRTHRLLATIAIPMLFGIGCPQPAADDDAGDDDSSGADDDAGDDDAGDDDAADDDAGDDDVGDDDVGDDDGADDDTSGDDDTSADPCLAIAPTGDPALNRQTIEACLAAGEAVLSPGSFPVDQGFTVPAGARLAGAGSPHTTLVLQGSAVNHLLAAPGGAEIDHLALDAHDQIPGNLNGAVIHVTGENNHVHHAWIGNTGGVSPGTHIAGVYFIDAASTGNVVELCEITDNFYGAIFVAGLPAGSGNRLEQNIIHDNRCDGITFAGYGEAVDNELFHHGWDCENGPIPGAHVYGLWNPDGALIQGNEMLRSCGHGIDLDGVAQFHIDDNHVSEPGYQWGGSYPWCGGAAAMALIDCADNTIENNVATNNDSPHNAGSDPNGVFHATAAAAFSDLPAGASTTLAFWQARRSSSPGAATHNTIRDNEFRSSCASPCVGVGYFSSRGTGTDAALGWSAQTTSYYTGNDPFGSDVGSVRCGANWYAANSTCPPNPTDPDCNTDDHQHTFDWSRNDDCRDF